MIDRRSLLGLIPALLVVPAAAHHGLMVWDEDNLVVIEGVISEEMDGFPHWEIEVRSDGEDWIIDMGSDFDMERAGLDPTGGDFPVGTSIRVEGYRPLNSDALLVKPRKITIGDKVFEFTTDWD